MIVVGAPLRAEQGLFNVAVVIHRGRILGAVPKSYLPEYLRVLREAPVPRGARSDRGPASSSSAGASRSAPTCCSAAAIVAELHAVRRDLRGPVDARSRRARTARSRARPCSRTCLPATSPSARPTTAARCAPAHSARTLAVYLYTAAGQGESTTDLAWDGQALICENGDLLAESKRFAREASADLRRRRPRPARRRPRRAQPLGRHDRRASRAAGAHAPDRVRAGAAEPAGAAARARSSASRTCPPTRAAATSAARRST